jgi:tetratricopeptide (TPR) repeat protein
LSINIVQSEEAKGVEQLKSILEDNPHSLEVNLAIAEYYLNNEMFIDAEPYLIKSIQIDENQANTHNHLGVVYFHQGDISKSEYHFKKALNIDLNMVEGYFNLGMLYQSQGRFEEALPYYNTVVTMEPDNAEIYNLMGQCATCLGMTPEAKEFFNESFRLYPSTKTALDLSIIFISQEKYSEAEELLNFLIEDANSKQAENNETESLNFTMGLVLKKQGKNIEAIKYFQNVLAINERNEQAFNYMGECCVELGMEMEAESFFAKATEIQPNDARIQESYQVIFQEKKTNIVENKRSKIAFFCGSDDNIIDHLSSKYEVTKFRGGTIQDMHNLMKWSDVSWFEWCDNFIIHASKLPKVCKTVCRLHSYEAFTDSIQNVHWKNVDDLIFVAPHIENIIKRQIPSLNQTVNSHVILNGVDLRRYTFKEREKGFNIAFVGYINHKKNPSLLLQCIKYLVDIDDRYILHIAGQHQELRFQLYFDHIIKEMNLDKNVVFHGWVNDVHKWLDDKHFTISTSVLESFCHGIADAMACGLKPLIHNFIGAKELYPDKYIFNSVKDFSEMVLNDDYNSAEYRKYIEENYSQERQFNEVEKLINSII